MRKITTYCDICKSEVIYDRSISVSVTQVSITSVHPADNVTIEDICYDCSKALMDAIARIRAANK